MIQFENITKSFGTQKAVQNLNLKIEKGELFGFLGPNGAGKTTSIKMLVGLINPTKGRIKVSNIYVDEDPEAVKKLTGYIPDTPFLYEYLTGREFLYFTGHIYKMDPGLLKRRIKNYEEIFEMGEWIDFPSSEYSHGMKQRVIISSCLIHNPELIVIDEPMVGLDPKSAKIVKNILVEKTKKGVTVFLSTHTLSVAEEICTKIGIINRGRLIADGSLEDLRKFSVSKEKNLEELYLEMTSTKV
ncbi:ABC transporter ATP-binding protein [candidate division WOR-3 bacterium]|nr:ABC transporter ATP-binding protein [candidate division WOR-3 bacterium]